MLKESVKLAGNIGTWYLVDEYNYEGYTFYEWESEQFGDEANHIITWAHYIVVLEDVGNGILDLHENYEEVHKKISHIMDHLSCAQYNDYLEKFISFNDEFEDDIQDAYNTLKKKK